MDFFENSSYGIVDGFDSAQIAPSALCHGHVWKISIDSIEINKFDNAYNSPNGLGIVSLGIHRFDLYFNRAMDVSVTPFLTFGVREPWTQHQVADSANWSADSTVWTAFYNIGIETGDGIQRVRVEGARDNEHFEIPIEDSRFEFEIQAAGAASIEFMATPGIGKVRLEWNRAGTEDALGYNMYRYYNITDTTFSTPVRINSSLITDTLYTDFNVIPDTNYHYYYKILGTDMVESDSSRIITAKPLKAANGDANGDLAVNVLDISSIIAYMLGQDPQPFLFDAADINGDHQVNILDVIGIVNIITGHKKSTDFVSGPAYIWLDKDVIRFQSDGQVAALQFELTGKDLDKIQLVCKQAGFEFAHGFVKGKLTGIIYSLSDRTIPEGALELLGIQFKGNNVDWGEVFGGDPEGKYVPVIRRKFSPMSPDNSVLSAIPNPFRETVGLHVNLTEQADIALSICDMAGTLLRKFELKSQVAGVHSVMWDGRTADGALVDDGVYLCKLEAITVSGEKLQSEIKIILVR